MTNDVALLDAAERLDTCVVSDALDQLGLAGATVGLAQRSGTAGTVTGWAVTTRVTDDPPDTSLPHVCALAVEHASATDVIVVAAGGRTGVSSWGGILSRTALARGVRGVIVDGACRDIEEARHLGFTIVARAVVPVSARGRLWHATVREPVACAGVTVSTGDLVVADANGVVFVARDRVEAVIRLAKRIADDERLLLDRVRSGAPLSSVMADGVLRQDPGP